MTRVFQGIMNRNFVKSAWGPIQPCDVTLESVAGHLKIDACHIFFHQANHAMISWKFELEIWIFDVLSLSFREPTAGFGIITYDLRTS